MKDDESLNLVNELGMQNLVAVRAPAPGAATANPDDGTTLAPQLELTTEVTESSSEVEVYVIPESPDGSSVTRLSRREDRSVVFSLYKPAPIALLVYIATCYIFPGAKHTYLLYSHSLLTPAPCARPRDRGPASHDRPVAGASRHSTCRQLYSDGPGTPC